MDNTIPVIIMTGYPSLENAISTLKNGVVDFLIKPMNLNQMDICLQRVFRERRLFIENLLLKKEVERKAQLERINKELVSKVEELHTINKVLNAFKSKSSSDDMFHRIVELALSITPAEQSAFFMVDQESLEPFKITAAHKTLGTSRSEPWHFPLEPIKSVIQKPQPLLVQRHHKRSEDKTYLPAMLVVPLVIRSRVMGVIAAVWFGDGAAFNEKDLYYLDNLMQRAAQDIESLALYENIYDNLSATLYTLVNAVQARDRYTQQHSNRVTALALVLAKNLNCSSEEIDILQFAGHLHDIGKIGIRDDILLKTGPLTDDEFENIKLHPIIGADILAHFGLWAKEKQIIRCHHERYDGRGYPDGLKGSQIPYLSRILSLADVYDAMASGRTYREKMPDKTIVDWISAGSGTQFDPKIVDAFMAVHHQGIVKQLYDQYGLVEGAQAYDPHTVRSMTERILSHHHSH
jgi:putative nucleotidyltransferase with HDIG domain